MSEHPEPEFPPPDDDARVVRPNFITEVIDHRRRRHHPS